MKTCRVCFERKPLSEFYAMKGMKDGHRNECKPCNLAQRKLRYNKEAAVARAIKWQKANPEKVRAYQAEYRSRPETKRLMRDLHYKRSYGISLDEFEAMWEAQGCKCLLCGCTPERGAAIHLDHDHVTGKIRGILCLDCNQGIGKLGDDPDRLRRAADYIRRHRAGV